jgi:uncharacterized protein YbjT (DUF2867 family)
MIAAERCVQYVATRMKILLFGATGMVGQGVLRECLLDSEVERVLSIVRAPSGTVHEKLREHVHGDFFDWSALEPDFVGFDACFFCLGVSSAGMKEADYQRVTFDLTLAVARVLACLNPAMVFIYVSGAGTDASAKGRSMWARVKGRTENALRELPFKAVYLFRPGFIQPLHGIKSKTRIYRILYVVAAPMTPLVRAIAPGAVTTTEKVGRAMLAVAKRGARRPIIENRDINALADGETEAEAS